MSDREELVEIIKNSTIGNYTQNDEWQGELADLVVEWHEKEMWKVVDEEGTIDAHIKTKMEERLRPLREVYENHKSEDGNAIVIQKDGSKLFVTPKNGFLWEMWQAIKSCLNEK